MITDKAPEIIETLESVCDLLTDVYEALEDTEEQEQAIKLHREACDLMMHIAAIDLLEVWAAKA